MQIEVFKVHGSTNKKGSKQNKIYNLIPSKNPNWYNTDNNISIWNINGDWSKIGIMSKARKISYTKNFHLIK
jgi:hypothetical protein